MNIIQHVKKQEEEKRYDDPQVLWDSKLRVTFQKPVRNQFDSSITDHYDFELENSIKKDAKGFYVKVGSYFGANFWFHVALGRTEKETWSRVIKRLKRGEPARSFALIPLKSF